MAIQEIMKCLKESNIFVLSYQGVEVGYRVKKYSVKERKFEYYDFDKRVALGFENFLKENHKSLEVLHLKEYQGVVCTDDEIQGLVQVMELRNEADVKQVLEHIVHIISVKI